jgi:hypothetical protein
MHGREGGESHEDFEVPDGHYISTCNQLRYLGSKISNDLRDTVDIDTRTVIAKAAFYCMRPVLIKKSIHRKQ